jgi:hypothetical protein
MCRFVLLHAFKENHKWYLLIYDRVRNYAYHEALWKFRMKYAFYHKHGVEKGDQHGQV